MIIFYLNGVSYKIDKPISLQVLVKYINYNQDLLVIEYNNKVRNKKIWSDTLIQAFDKIEFITIVGGG